MKRRSVSPSVEKASRSSKAHQTTSSISRGIPLYMGSEASSTGVAGTTATSGDSSGGTGLASLSSSRALRASKSVKTTSSASRSHVATAAAREEARRRLHDMRSELEGVIHVLDGGVNRTPLPLQPRQSLGGVPHDLPGTGGAGSSRTDGLDFNASAALMAGDQGSFAMRSSFLLNSSSHGSMVKHASQAGMHNPNRGSDAADHHGGSGGGGKRGGLGADSKSADSSFASFSFAGDRRLSEQSSSTKDSSSMRRRSVAGTGTGGGGGGGSPIPRLMQQNALLAAATYTPPNPLTASEKAMWRKALTTVILSETPTTFLYSHQDEVVSNENVEEVTVVTARNRDCVAAEEVYRTDEGTHFHATGVMTMRAPMKSVQTEVHPPAKKDSGGLQVTPWMLKDAYAATLEAVEDAEEDAREQRQSPSGEGGAEGVSEEVGDGGAEVDDALRDGDEMEAGGSMDDDGQSSENGQSTLLSSDTVTQTVASDGAGTAPVSDNAGAADAATAGVESSKLWMLAETLLSTLRIMERAVVQNNMEVAQLAYRGIAVDTAKLESGTATGLPSDFSGTMAGPPPASSLVPTSSLMASVADNRAGSLTGRMEADGKTKGTASIEPVIGGEGNVPPTAGRDVTAASAISSAAPPLRLSPGIQLLWRFGSPHITRDRAVTCMTWNGHERDMLAVGYTACRSSPLQGEENLAPVLSKRSQGQEPHGMICCWSLKNPLAPELILYLRSNADVTALAFSYEHPSLLAVGGSTGEMAVYDIQHDVVFPSVTPALVGASGGQHTGAIWELQWVPKGKEQGEFLTSISADGRVVQWAVGKNLERVPPDLMHLQRQPGTQVEKAFVAGVAEAEAAALAATEAAGLGKGGSKPRPRPPAQKRGLPGSPMGGGSTADDAILSRQCGGMTFDICPSDTAVYIVGTEDGSVLQCSKSQTENYDFEYESHSELVYRVRWSPYSAAYFLTCSADWTSRLYKVGTSKAQLRFHSSRQDAVQDVAWSNTNALIFATATAQGNAEVWSVTDTMCPRATVQYRDHRRLSAVLFAEQETCVLVVGDEEGDVVVFRLDGPAYGRGDLTDDEQEEWLVESVLKQLT